MADITVNVSQSISLQPAVSQGNRPSKYGTKVVFSGYEVGSYDFTAEETDPGGTLRGSETAKVTDAKKDVEITITLKDS